MTKDEALKLAREAFIAKGFWPNEVMWACWRDAWLAGAARERKIYALSKTLTQNLEAPLTLNGVALWPKREWVGLTEDELVQIGVATGLERAAAQMIESKLKEKNCD